MSERLTKVTGIVIEDNLEVEEINGHPISVVAIPNAIPAANESGNLDPSWGIDTTSINVSGSIMTAQTYDSNFDGKVNSADKADKITGTPPSNRVYGTDAYGNQVWKTESFNKTIYDSNNDGKVNSADEADQISGIPGPNKIYGTDSIGNKGFFSWAAGDMRRELYDTLGNGNKVDASVTADQISGNPTANQVYGVNQFGEKGWYNIGDLSSSGDMLKSVYDTNNDGIVNRADLATNVFIAAPFPNRIYGTDSTGNQNWLQPTNIPGLMAKAVYDSDSDGKVDRSQSADSIWGVSSASNLTFYGKDASGNIGFFSPIVDSSSLMRKTNYDTTNSGNTVDKAREAIKITVSSLEPNKIYGTDSSGNQIWLSIVPSAQSAITAINASSSIDASMLSNSPSAGDYEYLVRDGVQGWYETRNYVKFAKIEKIYSQSIGLNSLPAPMTGGDYLTFDSSLSTTISGNVFDPATPTKIYVSENQNYVKIKMNLEFNLDNDCVKRVEIRKGNVSTGISTIDYGYSVIHETKGSFLNLCSPIFETLDGDYFEVFVSHDSPTGISVHGSGATWIEIEYL